ncbi:MAG: hypothetical protein V4511_05775 [Bacteroidota bacterium]
MMTLSSLSDSDIAKLDELFNFLKTELTEKRIHGFYPIDLFCQQHWGENITLYRCFGTMLADNGLTDIQNHNGEPYIWGQKCSQNGIAFDSFKNEYARQLQSRKQEQKDKSIDRANKKVDWITKPVLFIIVIITSGYGTYKFFNGQKFDAKIVAQEKTIDSLKAILLDRKTFKH